MTQADRIIGRVAAFILSQRLADARQADGTLPDSAALFRLDKLSSSQIAAIVREILNNPALSAQVDLQIPEFLVEGEGLPEEALTTMNAGAVRNAGTTKEALLTANGNEHNLADTLGHVTALGAKELRCNEEAWVEATCHVGSIAPTFEDRSVFKTALRGLISVTDLSLIQLGEFCSKISEASHPARGLPIRNAIGWSLPYVGLPRDSSFFASAKTYGQAVGPWCKAFEKLLAQRAPLLAKQRSNGQPIDPEEMWQRLIENSASIDPAAQPTLEAFINAPLGDDSITWDVALLEWEEHGVHFIFEKPRERQQGLAESTIYFFEHDCADTEVLVEGWRKHLEDLKTRERRSDWNEEDEEFFELHRRYIEQDPKLHARWEKVIFGKPIDCTDFFEGILSVSHQLVASAAPSTKERFLRMTVNKGRKEWRERFNHDVGSYFSAMYRGLKELLGSKVQWRVEKMGVANLPDPLFRYPEFFEWERTNRKDKPKPVASIATKFSERIVTFERTGTRYAQRTI